MKASIFAPLDTPAAETIAGGWSDVCAGIDSPAAEASLELLAELAIRMLRKIRSEQA